MRFFYIVNNLGDSYPIQCIPKGYCLSTTTRYRVLVDWSADNPVLSYAEKAGDIKYPYPVRDDLFVYMNLTCWDLILFIENVHDGHMAIEETYHVIDTDAFEDTS